MTRTLLAPLFTSLLAATVVAGCASQASDSPEAQGSTDSALRASHGSSTITLANGADVTNDSEPDKLRVVAPVKGAKGKVKDSSLADCTVTVNHSLSTSSKTTFDLTIDYNLDDGWNGCTFEFTAPGYKSSLEAGVNVDD